MRPVRSAMARLTTSDSSVTLVLTRTERLVGFHGNITAPLTSIAAVRAADDLWSEVRGMRAPGIGIPGVLVVGSLRGGFGRDFAAVHRPGSGVVLEFDGEPFRRWVVSLEDCHGVVAELLTASRRTIRP